MQAGACVLILLIVLMATACPRKVPDHTLPKLPSPMEPISSLQITSLGSTSKLSPNVNDVSNEQAGILHHSRFIGCHSLLACVAHIDSHKHKCTWITHVCTCFHTSASTGLESFNYTFALEYTASTTTCTSTQTSTTEPTTAGAMIATRGGAGGRAGGGVGGGAGGRAYKHSLVIVACTTQSVNLCINWLDCAGVGDSWTLPSYTTTSRLQFPLPCSLTARTWPGKQAS